MEEVDDFNENGNYYASYYNSNDYDMAEVDNFNVNFNHNALSNVSTNDTDDSNDCISNYHDMIATTVFNYAVYVLYVLLVIGALGNFVLLAVFCCHRNLRTAVNVYILNTAVSDLVVILFLAPIYNPEDPMFPRIFIPLSYRNLTGNVAQTASVYSIAALSVERFLSVRRCSRDALLLHKARMRWRVALVLAIWASIAVVKLFILKLWNVHRANLMYVAAELVVGYVLPLLIIGFFCALTALTLRRISDCVPGESRARQLDRQKKAVRVVMILVVLYVLCFTLEYVLMLWLWHTEYSNEEPYVAVLTLHYLSICLRYLHSCINPLVLYFICSNWRVAMNESVCFICRK